jgi:hypothetical protein
MQALRLLPTSALAFILLLEATSSRAQCPFTPTITPDDLILCPNTGDVLTTQVYDSYQWYKAGAPLVGQTGQTLPVNAFNDAGYTFSVEATLDGCTEMSPEVLVDAWAFLGATIMTTGAEPLYFSQNGPVYCGLDTVLLVMMPPYVVNVQWTNNGQPIPGATDDTLMVTTAGNYSASGAPAICPNFFQNPGVEVGILFLEPTQPQIAPSAEQLCVTPTGVAYQWYLNGQPLAGTDSPCIEAAQAGLYTVNVVYEVDCAIPSDGFLVTGISDAPLPAALRVSPVPANDQLTISSGDGTPIGPWRLLDATGRAVLQGDGLKRSTVVVDVSTLNAGSYWLRSEGRASIVR